MGCDMYRGTTVYFCPLRSFALQCTFPSHIGNKAYLSANVCVLVDAFFGYNMYRFYPTGRIVIQYFFLKYGLLYPR